MSARGKLRACFPALPPGSSNDLIEAAVDEILNEHAHELAEKQRQALASAKRRGISLSPRYVINLIDPEAQR